MLAKFLAMNPLLIYLLAGVGGMLIHAVKKVGLKQTSSGFVDYFLHLPGRSIGAVSTLVATAMGLAAGGTLETTAPLTVLGLGFLAGFSCDSAVNSGAPPAPPQS